MAVLKPRTRLVYFRVSEEEFQELSRVCETEGARCLSDLLRSAMKRAVSGSHSNGNDSVAVHLRSVDDRIGQLATELQRLADFIQPKTLDQNPPDQNPNDAQFEMSAKGRTDAQCA